MNALTKIRVISRFPRIYRTYATKGAEEDEESPWYRDNAPGPYPKTEEEKCAAAKKYRLLREEYEPFPDDGNGFGDYPNIQPVNVDLKDPYYPWTDKHFRRNFGEVIPADFLAYTPGRVYNLRRESFLYWILMYLTTPIVFGTLFYFLSEYKVHHNRGEKQMFKPGATHYTFDLEGQVSAKHH